jgi:uncharacterized protein YkwD
MKNYFLGLCCACLTVMGVTTTVRADVSISVPTNQPDRAPQVNSDRQSTQTPIPAMSKLELATYNLVNKYRQSKNLPPLTADPAITAQARVHSENMARTSNLSHDGFHERAESVSQTIVYRKAAENVAYNMGYAQPDLIAIQDWIESPGHNRNMTGPFDMTGIGVSQNAKGEYYFTQIFIRKAFYVKDAD